MTYPFKTLVNPPNPLHSSFLLNPKGRTAKEQFISNPVCTDVTQAEQTDLKYLLSQNPDANGLSLILDDAQREELMSSVSIEDFLPPADHYDIFDIAAFIQHSKQQFNKLPVKLRMHYKNDPLVLAKALEDDYSATVADLSCFYAPLDPSYSGATASLDRDNQSNGSSNNGKVHIPSSDSTSVVGSEKEKK